MATLLDAPRPTARFEEFVEKQLKAAGRRVRLLDFFLAGLTLAIGSLAFLLATLMVDRYVETPRGTGWAVLVGYLGLAAGFLYLTLFRSSRRDINPYYAAHQVEQTVPDAKNSLVTFVDFEEDQRLPGSIRNAISQKAARDLKKVDLNRAIENRKIVWLAVAAGIFLLACVVVAFLPPTRTELSLEQPKTGDITVFNNQEVTFEVRVRGRIPGPNDADAVRLRMWYNPDDPDSYEDRPLKAADGDRRQFSVTVPPRQVRNGFHYRILAGKTQSPEYTVTCKIIPEFTGFEVGYEYPAYLKRDAQQTNDPNLLAPYGAIATLTVSTNRDVKHGHIEIEGQPRTIDGRLIEGRADAIQFTVPMEKEGFYRIWYTTPEGDKNQDPARLKLTVIDPKPAFRTFDIAYDYPAYLRFKPMTAADVREPVIEAPRGTKVVLTAKTTRGVKDAKIEVDGQPPVIGEPVPDEPTWVRFKLPMIDKDGIARISFTPTTGEPASTPRSIPIRALIDQPPSVRITQPDKDDTQIAANGTLDLKGEATDDHGVDKMTLRMKIAGSDRDLKPKPYRNGMSFLRKADNSWPTKVEYKDFVKLPDLRLEREPSTRITPGMEIEYWLEALDNCAVEPGPNRAESEHKRFKVIAPVVEPKEKNKIDQQNKKREQDQVNHEKKQDNQNQGEKRDVQQQPPQGAENPDKGNLDQTNPPKNPDGTPPGQPKDMNPDGKGENPMGTPPDANPDKDPRPGEIEQAIKNAEEEKNPANAKSGPNKPADAKVDPGDTKPQPGKGPMDPPPADAHEPKENPNKDMTGEGAAGGSRSGKVDNAKDEKAETKDAGMTPPNGMPEEKGGDKQSFGGGSGDSAKGKPDAKEKPMPGTTPKGSDDKGDAHPEKTKPDPKDPQGGGSTSKAETKPEKDVTTSDTKRGSGEQGPMGKKPPTDIADTKPEKSPEPGDTRPPPKKDDVADQGGARQGPKESDGAAGEKHPDKSPMGSGSKDDMAKGGTKSGPGTPPPDQHTEQGELDRDLGELDRDINSTNPKLDDRKKSDVERLMRKRETREQTRKKLDELERNAKDELTRKKAQDARAAGEKAAKDYDNEKPNKDNVETLSKKLHSDDKREREDAEQRIKDWEKDAQAKKDLQKETDELKKKDRNAGERVENATQKAEQTRKQSGNPADQPKMDEKDLQKLAKDLNGSDEKAKADAKQNLERMMQDPKSRQAAQDKLNEMAKNAEGQDKKDLQDAAKQAGDMAKQMAAKDPPTKPDPKVDPKDLKDAADKLASGDPKAQKEAMDKLKDMAKDPKTAAEMQKQLQDMANNAKTPEDKKALEDAAKQAGQLAKEMGPKDGPMPDPKDLKDIADKLAGKDPQAKKDAEQKLQDMMKDPKAREEALKQLGEMAKNAKPEDQKALQDALKQANEMAKNQPPKPDPKDLKDLAKHLEKMDPAAKEALRKQLEEAMKDPTKREEMEKAAKELAKQPKTPEEQKQFNDLMNQLGSGFPEIASPPDPADPKNKLKAAELLLEKFKDKIKDKSFKDGLGWTDEQEKKWMMDQEATIAALRKQVEKGDWRTNSGVRSPTSGGPTAVKLDPKNSGGELRGSRAAPPSGYADPFQKFTKDQEGSKVTEPKR